MTAEREPADIPAIQYWRASPDDEPWKLLLWSGLRGIEQSDRRCKRPQRTRARAVLATGTGWARLEPTLPRRRSRPQHASLDRPRLPCRTRRTIKVLGYCFPAPRRLGYTSARIYCSRTRGAWVFEAPRVEPRTPRRQGASGTRRRGYEGARRELTRTGCCSPVCLAQGTCRAG